MTDPIKVYDGLDHVERGLVYHMGHYAVDFVDGEMRFQLMARVCGESNCPCDNIQIDWHARGTIFNTWLTATGDWLDHQHQPVAEELAGVFRIVQAMDVFKERYAVLLRLRHKQVLQETGRMAKPFTVQIPRDMMPPSADQENHILGTVKVEGKKGRRHEYGYDLEFCGDPDCTCENIFLAMGEHSFCIEPTDTWTPTLDDPSESRLMHKVRTKLMRQEHFVKLLNHFRTERKLQNYHRHVHAPASKFVTKQN